MKKILCYKKHILLALLVACVGYMCACFAAKPNQAPPMQPQRAVWLVYWDWEQGLKEAQLDKEQTYIVFAAYFDKKGRLLLPEQFTEESLKNLPQDKLFLSIVNDWEGKKNQLLPKDTAVLQRKLSNKKRRQQHVQQIIALCKKNNFAGIEIDYENIWQNEKLMRDFALFTAELRDKSREAGLELRIVLEPKALTYAELLPENVEYVVMFYNLYGLHSGPGPKADEKFILRTLKKMEKLKGKPNVAFANGGFSWTSGRRAISVTSQQAVAIAQKHGVVPQRDAQSYALYFSYVEAGKQHTVWYADEKTLNFWCETAAAYGYKRFSLWRSEGK